MIVKQALSVKCFNELRMCARSCTGYPLSSQFEFCLSVCCCFVSAYVGVFCVLCEHVGGFVPGVFFVFQFVCDVACESCGFLVPHNRQPRLQLIPAYAHILCQPLLVRHVFFLGKAALVAEQVPAPHQATEHFHGVRKHPMITTVQTSQVRRRPKIQREPINRLRFLLQIRVTLTIYAH